MSFQTWGETLVTAQVDGTANTAGTAASCIPPAAKITLPQCFFKNIGQQLLIKASGRISSAITTPGTARFDVRLGGTAVFDGLAVLLDTVAAHTNVGWLLEVLLTCRAIGTTGNFMGQGLWTCEDILGVPATAPKGVLSAILPWNSAPAVGSNVDTTTALSLDLFFTQTVATGSMTLHQYSAISLN